MTSAILKMAFQHHGHQQDQQGRHGGQREELEIEFC
jgi:hypothetical protein